MSSNPCESEAGKEGVSCRICRNRKVKCDRTPGGCQRCRRFGAECIYTRGSSSPDQESGRSPSDFTTQAGLKRRRILRSCVNCKRAKVKCSGGAICVQCARKGCRCSYYEHASSSLDEVSGSKTQKRASPSIPAWLTARSLPPIDKLRRLIDLYFSQIHTVRCLGFLHIPTFMARLKDPDKISSEKSGLLYAMCALSAPFYYATLSGISEEHHHDDVRFFTAGKAWAEAARQHVFSEYAQPGMEALMTEVLLQEYYLRVGDYTKGFMISGQIARHLQLLQLNIEQDSDVLCQNSQTAATKESRRRLIWACYLLDALIECGIDQLRLVESENIHVQLPCLEENFVTKRPCITEMMTQDGSLPFIDSNLHANLPANLDMRAFYIRAIAVRSKILKFVKHLQDEVPWDAGSHFAELDKDLRTLLGSIPENLKMSTENTYVFKASGRLNLFFGLHILVSQNFHDLYRVGVSHLVFPNSATSWIRKNAPDEFIQRCHHMCLSKAVYIASLLKELWECDKLSIVDTPYAMHIQVCSSVLVTTLASWRRPEPLLREISHHDYYEMLQSNIKLLRYLQRYIKADMYCESAVQALNRFNQLFSPDSPGWANHPFANPSTASNRSNNPNPAPLETILNPLGTYPMARKQVQDQNTCVKDEATNVSIIEPSTGSIEASVSSAPEVSHPLYTFPSPNLDWDSEISIMHEMGYPTFLENFSIPSPATWGLGL